MFAFVLLDAHKELRDCYSCLRKGNCDRGVRSYDIGKRGIGISRIKKCGNARIADRFVYNELISPDSNRGSQTRKVVPLPYNLNIYAIHLSSSLINNLF